MRLKWWTSEKERFRISIDAYSRKLASSAVVSRDDVIACHTAKLVLDADLERRLRSIQTLAQLRAPEAIGPAVNDLVSASRQWPRGSSNCLRQLLRCLLDVTRRR